MTESRFGAWRMGGYGLAFGVATTTVFQAIPSLHIPTHEYIQFSGLVYWWGCLMLGRLVGRDTGGDAGGLGRVLGAGAGMMVGGFGWVSVLNATTHACRMPPDVSVLYWVTVVPLVLLGSVMGAIAGRRGWSIWRTIGLGVACMVASGIHDGLQYLNGVRIVDPLLGDPMGFNQRAEVALVSTHLLQRIWLALTAACVWFAWGSRTRAWVRGAWCATWILTTLGLGSSIGVGFGRSALLGELDGRHVSEHFVFRYSANGQAAVYLPAIERRAEWSYRELGRELRLPDGPPIEVRIYEDSDELELLTGIRAAHAGAWQIDLSLYAALGSTLRHEMVHARHIEMTWNPWILTSRGNLEGIAVAFTDGLTAVPEAHAAQAGALEAGYLPAVPALMSLEGFSTVNERNAYQSAGSFIGFLVLEHGIESLVALQRTWDPVAVYGKDWAALDGEWRAFLDTVEVELSEVSDARVQFDPDFSPSYSSLRCPKLGPKVPEASDHASWLYRQGAVIEAGELWESQWRQTGEVKWARQAALAYQAGDEHPRASALASTVLGDAEALPEDLQMSLWTMDLVGRLVTRDWPGVERAVLARARLEPEHRGRRFALQHLLTDPELREPVTQWVLGDRSELGAGFVWSLSDAHPDNTYLRWLALADTRKPPSVYGLHVTQHQREALQRTLVALQRDPGLCRRWVDEIDRLGESLFNADALELVEGLAKGVRAHCGEPLLIWKADAWSRRLEWEQNGRD